MNMNINRGINLSRVLVFPGVLQVRGIGTLGLQGLNSFGLRNKVEHLIRMNTPDAAEKILKSSKLEGAEYSWNLLIKHYAMLGNYKQAESTYMQVHFLSLSSDNR